MFKYRIENLDCANCALKINDKINKLDEVKLSSVNFMMETLIFELNEDANLDETVKKIEKIAKKVESDIEIKPIKRN